MKLISHLYLQNPCYYTGPGQVMYAKPMTCPPQRTVCQALHCITLLALLVQEC